MHEETSSPEQLTVREAAARLGVTSDDVTRWIEEGRLRSESDVGPWGPIYRVPSDAVETLRTA